MSRSTALASAVLLGTTLWLPGRLCAATSVSLGNGTTLHVGSVSLEADLMDPSSPIPRPKPTGIRYEVFRDVDGRVLEEGWLPGTRDSIEDGQPSIAYDPLTSVAVAAWSRDVGEEAEIFCARYIDGSWTFPMRLTQNQSPDRDPVLVMDDKSQAHLVWWEVVGENSEIWYRRITMWSDDFRGEEPIALDLDLGPMPEGLTFPFISYQRSTSLIYLVVCEGASQFNIYTFQAFDPNSPSGGGSLVLPVSLSRPPDGYGDSEPLHPMIVFVGDGEVPVVYWTEDEVLYYFYLGVGHGGTEASAIFEVPLRAEYDPGALETLVLRLAELQLGSGPPIGYRRDRTGLR